MDRSQMNDNNDRPKVVSFKPIELIRPFVSFLPDVLPPDGGVNFQEKIVWTTVALTIYLVASQVPLFGIMLNDKANSAYWLRTLTSGRGTLMDIGISPIVTSSIVMQFLTASSVIRVNVSVKQEKIYYECTQKLITILITLGQALVMVSTGMYGKPSSVGRAVCSLLVFQLVTSGYIVILLDEILMKGYGIGSGVNLFIVADLCENILWHAFSPKLFNTARGAEFEGCVISLFHVILSRRKGRLTGIYDTLFRRSLPNLSSLLSTLLIFGMVVYLQEVKCVFNTESTEIRGKTGIYKMKLMHGSTMPIITQNTIISHLIGVSRMLYIKFPKSFPVRVLGTWGFNKSGLYVPLRGICRFIYPPSSMQDFIESPVTFITYCMILLLSSSFLSKAWTSDFSNLSHHSVMNHFNSSRITVRGIKPKDLSKFMKSEISIAGFMSGFLTQLICLMSNLFNTIGSGTNIILAASVLSEYSNAAIKKSSFMR